MKSILMTSPAGLFLQQMMTVLDGVTGLGRSMEKAELRVYSKNLGGLITSTCQFGIFGKDATNEAKRKREWDTHKVQSIHQS